MKGLGVPGKAFCPCGPSPRRRLSPIPLARTGVLLFGILVVLAGTLAAEHPVRAALSKPAYEAGDRWVYVLQGSLNGLPGLNASQVGIFQLGLTGIVQVDIASAGPSGVQVETQASGFINGTFAFNGSALIPASGTFSSNTSEVWEGQDFLPVSTKSSAAYVFDVKIVISIPVRVDLWVNATTTYATLPSFDLAPGDSASAPFTSRLEAATSFSAFGLGGHAGNRTTVNGTWARQVLGLETVTVEAGTFSAYRLNESLGGFPGIGAALPSIGANETAWFSNDAGNYVRRVAYVNGSPVAEMGLKSYTYPVAPPGLGFVEIALLVAVPIAAVAVLVVLLLRRQKAQREKAKGSSGAGPVGELPPKRPGGDP